MGFAAVCFGVRVNGQSCVVADSEMAFFSPFVEKVVSFLGLRGIGSVVSWLDGAEFAGENDPTRAKIPDAAAALDFAGKTISRAW